MRKRPWITLLGMALVLYAIATLFAWWRTREESLPAGVDPAALDTSDRVVGEALSQIPPAQIDSAEIKTGWRDRVPGFDPSGLDSTRDAVFLRAANTRTCTCGCGFTLASCRTFDTTCPVSEARVRALRDSVRRDLIGSRGLRARPPHG
jgi:hypothetical protein